MPYEIRAMGDQFCVFKQGTEQRMGCHPTKAQAMKQMAALYANEPMMAGKSLVAMKATPLDDDAFRLLAFPFGGPLPSDVFPRGVDLDRETFTERTDIKRDW